MRLGKFDLLKYGRFTECSFELPSGDADFHIVFGSNEAGKSTALAAIGDLLFGIPARSPYNFLHDYADLQIGALLENTSATLEVRRRKGSRNTLLDAAGRPLPKGEGALRPFIAGADRIFFERMFSLDHARLRSGGREILDASDDVGQMLFTAGTGIGGLRPYLENLRAEADGLWSTRRSKHREFYIVKDRLDQAQADLRNHTLTAGKWKELKSALEKSREAYETIRREMEKKTAESVRLDRIRRVFRDVHRIQELERELETVKDAPDLPPDAWDLLAESERRDAEAAARLETLQQQLAGVRESIGTLEFDETLVRRADDVRRLDEKRIEIRKEKGDLPKREIELRNAEKKLEDDAHQLEWGDLDLSLVEERIIKSRTKVRVVRELLNQRGGLENEVSNQEDQLRLSRERHKGLEKQLLEAGDSADVSRLSVAVKTIQGEGAQTRAGVARGELKKAQGRLDRRLKKLNPGVSEAADLVTGKIPGREQLQDHHEREQENRRHLRETRRQGANEQAELDDATAERDSVLRKEQVVTLEELIGVRDRRDALWSLIKRRHLEGKPVPAEQQIDFEKELEDLGAAFEPAVAAADELADRRFEHAEAAGQVAEIDRKIGTLEKRLEQTRKTETELADESGRLKEEWLAMWEGAPVRPLKVEAMIGWLDTREQVLEAMEAQADANTTLQEILDSERDAKGRLLAELKALGVDVVALENDPLHSVIEHAVAHQRDQEKLAYQKAQLAESVEDAIRDAAQREGQLRKARQKREAWMERWESALDDLGISRSTAPEIVVARIETIEQMGGTVNTIRSLRHDRIDKINLDISNFEKDVNRTVAELAGELSSRPAEDAVAELMTGLSSAERTRDRRDEKTRELDRLKEQIAESELRRRELAASISHLQEAAGADDNEALEHAIIMSNRKREWEREHREILTKLRLDDDGKSFLELEEECRDVVLDEVTGRKAMIQASLEELQQQLTESVERRLQAERAFQEIGGHAVAAEAAAREQESLAEMGDIARRYVRLRTSATLLDWAIDRYRKEKQTPLLKRAGESFRIITGNSFSGLQIRYDEQDNAQLTGVRPDGKLVSVSGMSDGTVDQLYLVLRLAAIEDYLEGTDSLPFVADDLFINFDDTRAAAGFDLMGRLSRKTQVLFFTHHQHLVDIAQDILSTSVDIVNLTD